MNVCRTLEQDYKEKLAAVRSELMKEVDQIQQQAGLQREELEAKIEKIRGDESFLRDHLSISVKVPEGFYLYFGNDFRRTVNCLYAPCIYVHQHKIFGGQIVGQTI